MKWFQSSAALGVLLALLAIGVPAAAQVRLVSIGTGGATGVYFVVGNAICRMVNKEAAARRRAGRDTPVRCAAKATGGSTDNINRIDQGNLDFGVAQSDWQHHAASCSDQRVACVKDLRSVFSLFAEPFHLVVAEGSGIAGLADLKGKRVNIGNPGSGQRATMEVLMAAHGLAADDLAAALELASSAQARALCDGTLDAFGYTAGVPNAGVALIAETCGAKVVGLEGGIEARLIADHPHFIKMTIPKGTYSTTVQDVATFGVVATLVTRDEVAEDLVYELTRAVFENLEQFRGLHPAFAGLDPARMSAEALSAPLHPGALRYYRESGWK